MKPKQPIKPYKISDCIECGRTSVPVSAKRCINYPWCNKKHRAKVSVGKVKESDTEAKNAPKQKPISKQSDKQAKLNRLYAVAAVQYKKNYPICKAQIKCNGASTTDVHHKRGRGEYLLDSTTWFPVCRACHDWIELNPAEAKEKGFSESRLSNH